MDSVKPFQVKTQLKDYSVVVHKPGIKQAQEDKE